jgi:hypothetical protein
MKNIIKSALLSLAVLLSANVQAAIIPVSLNTVDDSVVGDSGWLNEDTFGDALDFFVLDLSQATDLSIQVNSAIAFGISVYQGEIVNDFGINFDNDGDFFDFASDLLFVDGTSSLLPGFGNPEFVTTLSAGIYTIAVGGSEGFFDLSTRYDYNIAFSGDIDDVQVSAPSMLFSFALFLMAVMAIRKEQQK